MLHLHSRAVLVGFYVAMALAPTVLVAFHIALNCFGLTTWEMLQISKQRCDAEL